MIECLLTLALDALSGGRGRSARASETVVTFPDGTRVERRSVRVPVAAQPAEGALGWNGDAYGYVERRGNWLRGSVEVFRPVAYAPPGQALPTMTREQWLASYGRERGWL